MKPGPTDDAERLPSWRWPLVLGAVSTIALHCPVLWENLLWVVVCGSFGITGMFCGVLPAWVAMRRDPAPALSSGFAVSFIAVGIGAILLAIATLLHGFTVTPEQEALWREDAKLAEVKPELLEQLFAQLRGGQGSSWTVFGAALLTFGGGIAGATVAAIRGRRRPRT